MKLQKKIERRYWHGAILPLVIFLCLLFFFYIGINGLSSSADRQSLKILQDAVYRSVAQCYAVEGMYPPNIQYLEDYYGLIYNQDQYIVHYEVFAANILPDIIIIDKFAD